LATQLLTNLDVLVIDDDPDARELLVHALCFYGANAIAVDSASAARCVLATQTPHVLVSDIGMPDEDGYSFIRSIRELEHGAKRVIPAVALTAFGSILEQERALACGFDLHLTKPVQPWVLAGILRELAPISARHTR
jgi:CheY-like chemotaxis protein